MAGAGRLQPDTEIQWGQQPDGEEWTHLVNQLRAAPPVPWQQLHTTITTLQHLDASNGQPVPPAEQAAAERIATTGAQTPHGSHVHLNWAIAQVSYQLPSSATHPATTAQETLLQAHLGTQGASTAATLAQRWGRSGQHLLPPQRLQHEQPARTAPLADPDPDPETSDSTTSSQDSSSTTSSTETASATTSNSPPPAAEQPSPLGVPQIESRQHHSSDTPTPANNVATNPAHVVPNEYREAWLSLDDVDLHTTLQQKHVGFQSPPNFIRGRIRQAMTMSLTSIIQADTHEQKLRAWKLWMLLPRMLMHRPPNTRQLSKEEWRTRIAHFQAGRWTHLLDAVERTTPTQPGTNTLEQRARRGELSAARQALTAGPLAPGDASTLEELRDPTRRPAAPYGSIDAAIMQFVPAEPLQLPDALIINALRRTRKGAAPGPSGLPAETLRLVLDDADATQAFLQVSQLLAQADLPQQASNAIALGRLVALQKPTGRIRGLVVGDLLRRVVSRSIAQHYGQTIHTACSPHQFALSTRAGTEAVVHALTATTQLSTTQTILSVDGVGAYDTISRASMLRGLHATAGANACLPFVRMFYTETSHYVWHDGNGQPHVVTQAEGGEQGDPLLPALFSLGQHQALQAAHEQLQAGETLYAFLDDIYVTVSPERVRPVYDLLSEQLFNHTRIQLNTGKTRVWNGAGQRPPNLTSLGSDVWVGNPALPSTEQGLTVLGAPIGHADFIQTQLQQASQAHTGFLQDIPALDDLQASWLLLLFCASPRCNYLLRMLPPLATTQYAQDHDTAVAHCFTTLLDTGPLPATALAIAHLPLSLGGLGLTAATLQAQAAHWASWADAIPVLQQQVPITAATLLQQLQNPTVPALQAATASAHSLTTHGWEPPEWIAFTEPRPPAPPLHTYDGPNIGQGWQHPAATAIHTSCHQELLESLDPPSRAMLESQSGPHASRAFTTIPSSQETTYPSHLYRLLLLRRLRRPLPLTNRFCRCRRALDPFGDHRAACAQAGILRSRGGPLERAAARICREAGARVTTNTRIVDLNIDHVDTQDDRRIEVIANGLPLWGGAQLAVDTTLVSPLTRAGHPRMRGGQYRGTALRDARRNKERTYPELLRDRRCRLVVLGIEVGGRWSDEAAIFLRLLAHTKARQAPALLRHSLTNALIHRWSAMLTHAAMHAFAASLLDQDLSGCHNLDGNTPSISEILAEVTSPPHYSRLPALL